MSRNYDAWPNQYTPFGWTVLVIGTLMVVVLFVFGVSYLGTKAFRQPTEYDVCIQHGHSVTRDEHGMSCIED